MSNNYHNKTKKELVTELLQLQQELCDLKQDRGNKTKGISQFSELELDTRQFKGNDAEVNILDEIQEQLRQSNHIVQCVLNAIPARVFWKDLNLNYLGCNNLFAQDAGLSDPKEIVGKNDSQLSWRDKAEMYQADDEEVIQSGISKLNIEEQLVIADGKIMTILTNKTPLINSTGKIEGVIGTFTDISHIKYAEKALRNSEMRYRAFINADTDMMFVKDNQFRYKIVNNAMASFFGKSPEEMLGKLDSELADKQIAFPCKSSDIRALESNAAFTVEEILGDRHCETTKFPIVLDDNTVGIGGIIRDVTERKLAEQALQLSEDMYRTMVEHSNDLIWTLDTNGNFTFLNDIAAKTTGLSSDEWTGRSFIPLILEEDLPNIMEVFNRNLKGEPCNYELRFKKSDDELLTLAVNTSPIFISGKVEGIVSFGRDITAQKKSEENLKNTLFRYKALLEAVPDMMFLFDKEGFIIEFHAENDEDLYLAPDVFVGKNVQDVLEKELAELTLSNISRVLSEGQTAYSTYKMVINGMEKHFESRYVSCGTGQVLSIVRNITERYNFDKELLTAKKKAEESDKLKSAFLANISHEIRTPMNGILGFSELLKEPSLSGKEQQEYIKYIEESGSRMLNIINDIVLISTIESGQIEVEKKKLVVDDHLEMLRLEFKEKIFKRGLKLSIKKPDDPDVIVIHTDIVKFKTIFSHLISNATKYSEKGTIEIGYSIEDNYLEFFVKDMGIGISPERQEAIFERFVQADLKNKMARQGAGLGLTITKAYVEMLGGAIWVESELGEGSTFYFTIPS